MLAALGLDGFRGRRDELGLALAGILIATVGVCGPWFDQADTARLGVLGDSGRFCLVALIAAFVLLWRYANLGGPGHLLGLLGAGLAVLLVAAAQLIQLESTYGDAIGGVHAQPTVEARWGLWVTVIGASVTMLGALVGAQLRANRDTDS